MLTADGVYACSAGPLRVANESFGSPAPEPLSVCLKLAKWKGGRRGPLRGRQRAHPAAPLHRVLEINGRVRTLGVGVSLGVPGVQGN